MEKKKKKLKKETKKIPTKTLIVRDFKTYEEIIDNIENLSELEMMTILGHAILDYEKATTYLEIFRNELDEMDDLDERDHLKEIVSELKDDIDFFEMFIDELKEEVYSRMFDEIKEQSEARHEQEDLDDDENDEEPIIKKFTKKELETNVDLS